MSVTLSLHADPVPYVGIILEGFNPAGVTVTLWREWAGRRAVVRGAGSLLVAGSDYVIDWEAPIGVPVTYRAEVITGDAPTGGDSAATLLTSESGWLSDPLDPTGGVPVTGGLGQGGGALTVKAGTTWGLSDPGGIIDIPGSGLPVGYGPGVASPRGVPMDLITATAEETARLAALLERPATQFLFRALPEWAPFPPVGYWRITRSRAALGGFLGGQMWRWTLTGTQVRPQTLHVVAPLWTYTDVQALREGLTYAGVQQAATAAGATYTADKADPRMGG